jgi:hypothetical protein
VIPHRVGDRACVRAWCVCGVFMHTDHLDAEAGARTVVERNEGESAYGGHRLAAVVFAAQPAIGLARQRIGPIVWVPSQDPWTVGYVALNAITVLNMGSHDTTRHDQRHTQHTHDTRRN